MVIEWKEEDLPRILTNTYIANIFVAALLLGLQSALYKDLQSSNHSPSTSPSPSPHSPLGGNVDRGVTTKKKKDKETEDPVPDAEVNERLSHMVIAGLTMTSLYAALSIAALGTSAKYRFYKCFDCTNPPAPESAVRFYKEDLPIVFLTILDGLLLLYGVLVGVAVEKGEKIYRLSGVTMVAPAVLIAFYSVIIQQVGQLSFKSEIMEDIEEDFMLTPKHHMPKYVSR